MLFRKYDIVVFKDNEGVCRKLRIRGWLGVSLLLIFVALVAGNVYFWHYFTGHNQLRDQLIDSEKTISDQTTQLLSLTTKLDTLEQDIRRIREFDAKLRVMINMDKEQTDTHPAAGGPERIDFDRNYLPVHKQELLARNMHNFLNLLNTEVQLEKVVQEELLQAFQADMDLLSATPTIWPTEGWVSSPFGDRISPFTGKREPHQGIDISGKIGTPIYAPAKGVVTFTGEDGSYGRTVVIKHGSGLVTRYAHLHRFAVSVGQTVERGDIIAYLGNSGRSTGPHLHYEVLQSGVCVNPMRYILN